MKDRQHFLDVLRVAATCAVVLLHTVTGVMDNTDMSLYPSEQKLFLVIRDLVCWCVPVFILISGYLFLNPERELTAKQMVLRYCRRVVLALLLFGVPYAWMELAVTEGHFQPRMLWQGVEMVLRWETWSHMWYLYLILILYLLTPAIRWVLKRLPQAAVCALTALLFVFSSILPFTGKFISLPLLLLTVSGECVYLFYYLCGYLFLCRKEWKKGHFPLFVGLAVVLAAGMAFSRLAGFSVQMAYNYPFTVLLTLCLFGAGLVRERNREQESREKVVKKSTVLWEKAAQLCFTVYLIHPVFLNVSYKYFNITPLSFSIGISLPLFFLGTLFFSCIAAYILRMIPVLRKYVL